ncbi:hypothetical protein ABT187_49120 [Streptomyces sp. NPDC001817]|uniref:hypothetical protein n=1 Tax=Streptomyces sp. NPDC001817 TaxID=3154398 RepID=UPI00332B3F95
MVALGECGTRSVAGAVFGSFAAGGRTLARRLLPHSAPGMLGTAGRGFPSFTLWRDAQATGPDCCGVSRTPSPCPSANA